MHAVAGGGSQPAGHGARFVDALFQDTTLLVFPVIHDLAGILGLVFLTTGGVDPQLPEQPLHAKGTRLIRHDRHHPLADLLVLDQRAHHAHKRHGGGNFPVAAAFQEVGKDIQPGQGQRLAGLLATHRHITAQLVALLFHEAHFRRVGVRPIIGHVLELFVGERHIEAITEFLETFQIQLLHLVSLVDRFTGTGGVPFYGLGQNHRGPTGVVHRRMVGRVYLERIMPTTIEAVHFIVGHMLHQLLQLRVLTEEMLTGVGAAVFLVGLVFPVHALFHAPAQQALVIPFQ